MTPTEGSDHFTSGAVPHVQLALRFAVGIYLLAAVNKHRPVVYVNHLG